MSISTSKLPSIFTFQADIHSSSSHFNINNILTFSFFINIQHRCNMPSQGFKAIVVGGGPIGLTAAHALSCANIDFVLLERRSSPVIDAGSNLVLNPMGIRALDQLGLGDSLEKVSSTLGLVKRQDHQGHDIGDAYWFILFNKL
jgi:hypothetical protein